MTADCALPADTPRRLARREQRLHDASVGRIDLADAQQQIHLRDETLRTALSARRPVEAAYRAGKENLTRLNDAQRDVISADANLALARIRLRQAWSDLTAAAATHREAAFPEQPERDPG